MANVLYPDDILFSRNGKKLDPILIAGPMNVMPLGLRIIDDDNLGLLPGVVWFKPVGLDFPCHQTNRNHHCMGCRRGQTSHILHLKPHRIRARRRERMRNRLGATVRRIPRAITLPVPTHLQGSIGIFRIVAARSIPLKRGVYITGCRRDRKRGCGGPVGYAALKGCDPSLKRVQFRKQSVKVFIERGVREGLTRRDNVRHPAPGVGVGVLLLALDPVSHGVDARGNRFIVFSNFRGLATGTVLEGVWNARPRPDHGIPWAQPVFQTDNATAQYLKIAVGFRCQQRA